VARRRKASKRKNAAIALASGSTLASRTFAGTPVIGDAAVILFAVASWYAVTTMQLWRAYRLVKRSNPIATMAEASGSAVANRHPSIR
jgi:hypothetical protein